MLENNIRLIGRLTSEPEVKQTPNGVSVLNITIAVDRPRVKDKVDFINCVIWRSGAEYVAKYGKKGARIAVEGILTTRKYTDKEGVNRTAFDVQCDDVKILSNPKGTGTNAAEPAEPEVEEDAVPEDASDEYDESLPF